MALKYIDQLDLKDKRVIARFDFNVPLKEGRKKMAISDSTRIDLALDTIRFILDQGASKLVLMSHLGRPKGQRVDSMSLEPVADYLAKELGKDVILTESCTDRGIKTVLGLSTTKIVLLENLRFHNEEVNNDPDFAKTLASYGDVYINDAFGAAHRKHASVHAINLFFKNKAAAGFLMQKELKALDKVLHKPSKPFVAVIGGAKVSDKIKIIEALLPKIDQLIIGGAMAYPFLAAKGIEIGDSLCPAEDVNLAKNILKAAGADKISLPQDHIVATSLDDPSPKQHSQISIEPGHMALDIGENTLADYGSKITRAKTVLWNGPMGMFEKEAFSKGTFGMARALAELSSRDPEAFTLVGGGDSVSAIKKAGLAEKVSHVSTGGGASLEYIEKGSLPGVQALRFGLESTN